MENSVLVVPQPLAYDPTLPFDPYALMGVARDALPADIKRAFRRLVKERHSDTGGKDEAAFLALMRAYDVLMDPARRALWDRFRMAADDAAVQAAQQILAGLLDDVVGEAIIRGREPNAFDICAEIRRRIYSRRRDIDASIEEAERRAAALKKYCERIRRKAKGENLLAHHLQKQKSALLQQKDGLVRQQMIVQIALDDLQAYESPADDPPEFARYPLSPTASLHISGVSSTNSTWR